MDLSSEALDWPRQLCVDVQLLLLGDEVVVRFLLLERPISEIRECDLRGQADPSHERDPSATARAAVRYPSSATTR